MKVKFLSVVLCSIISQVTLAAISVKTIPIPCNGDKRLYQIYTSDNREYCFKSVGSYIQEIPSASKICPGIWKGYVWYHSSGHDYASPTRGPSSACYYFTNPLPTVTSIHIIE